MFVPVYSEVYMRENKWKVIPYGLIVGATMMVPGVSGGSMAMILGIYDRLLSAVSTFGKRPKENFLFLASFALSGAVGIFLFSAPLSWLLEHFPAPTMYFFLGAVFGGVPMICKKAESRLWSADSLIYIMTGILLVLLLGLIPMETIGLQDASGLKYQAILVLLGIPVASALVLPGVSVSHFLLVLGLYEKLIHAIKYLDFKFLFPLGLGILLGVVLVTKGLDYILTHYPKVSYLVILGFVLGSAVEIFPGISDVSSGIWAICMGLAGYGVVCEISNFNIFSCNR